MEVNMKKVLWSVVLLCTVQAAWARLQGAELTAKLNELENLKKIFSLAQTLYVDSKKNPQYRRIISELDEEKLIFAMQESLKEYTTAMKKFLEERFSD